MEIAISLVFFVSFILYSSCLSFSGSPFLSMRNSNCVPIKHKLGSRLRSLSPCNDDPPNVGKGNLGKVDHSGTVSTVTVTCDEGFLFPDLTSERVLTFEAGKWRIMEDCIEVQCPDPVIGNAMITGSKPYRHLKMITVTCDTGYILNDGSDTYTAQCTKYRTWSNTETCKKKTCTVPDIDNVNNVPSGPYDFGDVLMVTCKTGYELSSGSLSYPTQCMSTGTFDKIESCTKVQSAALTVANAKVEPSSGPFEFGDEVTVTCEDCYVLADGSNIAKVEVTALGAWNANPSCTMEMCSAEGRSNTKLKDDSLPNLPCGSKLNVVCSDDYLTSTAETIYESSCEKGGAWSHTDDCTYEVANACPETSVYNTMQSGDVIPLSVEGTILTVECASGKRLPDGTSTMYVATCTAGVWDDTRSCGIKSCKEALDEGLSSGVYKIYPDAKLTEMEVYCDFDYESGKAWTVIQKRVDASVDFDRSFTEYENPFGTPNGNFWLGLINMNILTNAFTCKLAIEVTKPSGSQVAYAFYTSFTVGDTASKYALGSVHGFQRGSPNAGNGFYGHTGSKFSTPEQDNDNHANSAVNCAEKFSSGWWFNECGQSNLNGPYVASGVAPIDWGGVSWRNWIGRRVSATQARMMLNCV